MPFDEPIWRDGDPSKSVTAQALTQLGKQYATVAADADQPDTPVGAAVARAVAASGGGGGGGYTDNGDGTLTLNTGGFTDNGDGTLTLGG